MRRPLLASFALASLAAPLFALAAFVNPSDLLLSSQLQNKPLDVSYEAHVTMQDTYVSVWLKGAMEGKDPQTMKADVKLTVDASVNGAVIRGKFALRTVNGAAYARLESVTGDYENDEVKVAAEAVGKRWYAVPLAGDWMGDTLQREAMARTLADALLQMTSAVQGKNTVYSLTLRPDAAQAIGQAMEADPSAPGLNADDVTSLAQFLAGANVHVKVTARGDDLTGVKLYVAGEQDGARVVVQGMATVRSKPVTVDVPAGAVDLESQLQQWGVDPSFLLPMSDLPTWDESSSMDAGWEEEESSSAAWDPCADLTPVQKLEALRHGQCGFLKPSPRSFKD
jgi:hypothetical protein